MLVGYLVGFRYLAIVKLTLVTRLSIQASKDLEDIAVAVVTFELVARSIEAQHELPWAGPVRFFWIVVHGLRKSRRKP